MIEGTHAATARATADSAMPDRPQRADPRRRMSDQIAYALLVYTALQIFATVAALQGTDFALLPYLALVALVLAIIPACRLFEQRWGEMSDAEATAPATMRRFRRDRTVLWALALGLPFLLTALFKGGVLLLV